MATHSNILAWRISWTEEPGGLQSIGLQRVRHDWSDLALEHWREVKTSKYRHCHRICPAQDCLATVARPNINLKVNASFLLNPKCPSVFWDSIKYIVTFSSVQSLSRVQLFVTPWTAAHWTSLSITNSRVYSNSCPLSGWCHPTISSSVVPFSSCLQSFPASGSF